MCPIFCLCCCSLSEFGQLIDSAWYLPLTSDVSTVVTPNMQTFAECAALCEANSTCQFVTYDYNDKSCTVRNSATVVYTG